MKLIYSNIINLGDSRIENNESFNKSLLEAINGELFIFNGTLTRIQQTVLTDLSKGGNHYMANTITNFKYLTKDAEYTWMNDIKDPELFIRTYSRLYLHYNSVKPNLFTNDITYKYIKFIVEFTQYENSAFSRSREYREMKLRSKTLMQDLLTDYRGRGGNKYTMKKRKGGNNSRSIRKSINKGTRHLKNKIGKNSKSKRKGKGKNKSRKKRDR
jgi:hypothetical protein